MAAGTSKRKIIKGANVRKSKRLKMSKEKQEK
jgi:hypothetical protein